MAEYVLPQVLVSQEFQTAAAVGTRTLNAHIAAPHAYLLRYSEDDEKDLGYLGYYDPTQETCYSWPHRPAGGIVDDSYVKLFIDNALLEYFADSTSDGDTINTPASGVMNRLRASTLAFTDNGDDYPKSAAFLDRGVKVGDTARIRFTNTDSDPVTLWTYVKSFDYETVAAVIAAASSDTDNDSTQIASNSYSQTAGNENCVDISSASHAAYDGLLDGDITETYTVEVIESSTGGDLTTAKFRVTSASGHDDVSEKTPSATGVATAIGTRGLTVTWTHTDGAVCSEAAYEDAVSSEDFIVGQKWEIEVNQAFTKPVATSGGTYVGEKDTQYIVEVTSGGKYSGTKPKITVSTSTGIDISGPTEVSATATPVSIGTNGVTISFSQTALNKGDRYYIDVTAATEGRASTIVFGHNMVDAEPSTDVSLNLYIRKNIEVNINRTGFAPVTNFTIGDTEICVADAITVYEDSWTDDGELQPLDVKSESTKGWGKAYVQYRAWVCDLGGDVGSISDVGEIDDLISGALHPDNPLKYAVSKALANSSGTAVKYTAVCDPDSISEWTSVLDLLDGLDGVYGLVPCTYTQEVLDLWEAHVKAQSEPEMGRWRVMWANLQSSATKVLVNSASSTDDEEVLATIIDNPDASSTQYTLLQVPAGNGQFIVNGVTAGDTVRYNYTTDGFGGVTYSEAIVDDVVNEDTLLLLTGINAAVNSAAKIEIWHNQTASEQAAAIAVRAGAYACRRVMAVWPDTIDNAGTTVNGYHLCAALAGLASGVVPHQGLTNVEITGFDSVPRTTKLFNRTQLNTMALAGTWIVTQNLTTGEVYSRHAETTGGYEDINQREEMVTRNLDSISYLFMDRFAPYIGKSNVTPSIIDIIEAETLSMIQYLRQNNYIERLGGQLIDGRITDLRRSVLFRDRIVLALALDIPYPLNNLEVHLVI